MKPYALEGWTLYSRPAEGRALLVPPGSAAPRELAVDKLLPEYLEWLTRAARSQIVPAAIVAALLAQNGG